MSDREADDRQTAPAIVVEGLRKRFGDVVALDGIDFAVPAGTVLGLLGPNGAGKTTDGRVLTTTVRPDAGRATVLGVDVMRHPAAVRARIGLAGQYAAVDDNLTGRENLRMVGQLAHLPRPGIAARATELLERFDLVDAADRPVRTYSGACAGASTSRRRSCTGRRCCSSTSRPPASTPRAGPVCGSSSASSSTTAPRCC